MAQISNGLESGCPIFGAFFAPKVGIRACANRILKAASHVKTGLKTWVSDGENAVEALVI